MRRSTLATFGAFAGPVCFAASALLSVASWVPISLDVACLSAASPTDVEVDGEGAFGGERTWFPVGERCTWATTTGGTVTTTRYDLGANAGLYGGAAGMLASVTLFMLSAKAGDDDSPLRRRAAQPKLH